MSEATRATVERCIANDALARGLAVAQLTRHETREPDGRVRIATYHGSEQISEMRVRTHS